MFWGTYRRGSDRFRQIRFGRTRSSMLSIQQMAGEGNRLRQQKDWRPLLLCGCQNSFSLYHRVRRSRQHSGVNSSKQKMLPSSCYLTERICYSKAEKYVNKVRFQTSLFAGKVLRRKVPRTLTVRQHAHSVLIHAICIPNLANSRVKVIIDFAIIRTYALQSCLLRSHAHTARFLFSITLAQAR